MIIICPSHRRAMYEFGKFVYRNEPFIQRVNRRQLTVILNGGYEYRFMSEQNSAEKLKGTHTDYMFIDGFLKEQKMGMSNLDGYHPNKNESYQLGYQQGRADLKKEYEDLIIGLTKEEVRRLRVETIDECISKIKEEWSYYDNTCYEICNELEKLKHQ